MATDVSKYILANIIGDNVAFCLFDCLVGFFGGEKVVVVL